MKTKIDIMEILKDNEYDRFDFQNIVPALQYTVDGQEVSLENLKDGVCVANEFYLELKEDHRIQYKKGYDLLFDFKIGITKLQHHQNEYWMYNGFVEIIDNEIESRSENIDGFWKMYSDFSGEFDEKEILRSLYCDAYSPYGLVEEEIYKFSPTGVYSSFEEAFKEFRWHMMNFADLIDDKYRLGNAFIEHLESI